MKYDRRWSDSPNWEFWIVAGVVFVQTVFWGSVVYALVHFILKFW